MNTKLKELKEKEKNAITKLRHIQYKIEDLEENKKLPGLRKQYEGKYFRYENSYGPGDIWGLYIKIEKVKDCRWFHTLTFQEPSGCKIEIEVGHVMTATALGVEITEEKFYTAFDRMIKNIQNKFARSKK